MRRLVRGIASLITAAAMAGAMMTAPALAADEVIEPAALASIGGYAQDRDDDLYDSAKGLRCGSTKNASVQSVYTSDTGDNTTTQQDFKIGFLRFDLGSEERKTKSYTLTMRGGASTNTGRQNPIKFYAAVANVSAEGVLGKTAVTEEWSTTTDSADPSITWLTRPTLGTQVINAGTVSYNKEEGRFDDVSVDVTSLLAGKTGNVTIALLADEANSGSQAEGWFSDPKLTIEDMQPLSADTAIWAQDIVNRNTSKRGTEANSIADNCGTIKADVTEEQLDIFKLFLGNDITAGTTSIGSRARLNCLDYITNNSANAAKWNGYIEDTITAPYTGKYDIYFLGTGADNRNFAITVGQGTPVVADIYKNLTSSTVVHQQKAEIELEKGENKIHIQAPQDKSAMNVIAFYVKSREYTITWQQDDETEIDTTVVRHGEMPVHDEPSKAADSLYTYTFNGWSPSIVAATANAIYKATYTMTPTASVSDAAQAAVTSAGTSAPGTSSWNITVNAKKDITTGITLKADGETIMEYSSDNSVISAGETVKFAAFIEKEIDAEDITLETDGKEIPKQ